MATAASKYSRATKFDDKSACFFTFGYGEGTAYLKDDPQPILLLRRQRPTIAILTHNEKATTRITLTLVDITGDQDLDFVAWQRNFEGSAAMRQDYPTLRRRVRGLATRSG